MRELASQSAVILISITIMFFVLGSLVVLCSAVALVEGGAFGSVNFYADSSCTIGYNPRTVGATASYISWPSIAASSLSNISTSRCVNNPISNVASAAYSCTYAVDTVTGSKLQAMFVSEYNEPGCGQNAANDEDSPMINYYVMSGNGSALSPFPLCVDVSWFNARNHSSFYARIACNGLSVQGFSSASQTVFSQAASALSTLPDDYIWAPEQNTASLKTVGNVLILSVIVAVALLL